MTDELPPRDQQEQVLTAGWGPALLCGSLGVYGSLLRLEASCKCPHMLPLKGHTPRPSSRPGQCPTGGTSPSEPLGKDLKSLALIPRPPAGKCCFSEENGHPPGWNYGYYEIVLQFSL